MYALNFIRFKVFCFLESYLCIIYLFIRILKHNLYAGCTRGVRSRHCLKSKTQNCYSICLSIFTLLFFVFFFFYRIIELYLYKNMARQFLKGLEPK